MSDSEDEVLAAAAAWAEDDEDDEVNVADNSSAEGFDKDAGDRRDGRNKGPTDEWLTTETKVYSVHITQLPYEASVREVRSAFEKKGCVVTSIRFVYGRDEKRKGERSFRGVAFIDVADESSFKLALELDKTLLPRHGRRMNVRPTKTKKELAAIVERTTERLASRKIDKNAPSKGNKVHRRRQEARKRQSESGKEKKWSGKAKRRHHGGKGRSGDGSQSKKRQKSVEGKAKK